MRARSLLVSWVCFAAGTWSAVQASEVETPSAPELEAYRQLGHWEVPSDPYLAVPVEARQTQPARRWRRGSFVSVQVNVDSGGNNIVGDAANEPSIAVDPTNPDRMAIGWRQFDSIASSFRQAGWGFTTDGGVTWTFPGSIEAGVFRSDPVLASDAAGTFFYLSLQVPGGSFLCDAFRSTDGGATWDSGVSAQGGDKAWLDVDRSGTLSDGHVYSAWSINASCCGTNVFTRSVNGGASFEAAVPVAESPIFGATATGPDGEVYVVGRRSSSGSQFIVSKSVSARDSGTSPSFESSVQVDLGGSQLVGAGPNPAGLLGQVWVAVNPAPGPRRGEVYVLASVDPPGTDPMDVHLIRSSDGGATWSTPVRINDDPADNGAWQWFGTLSVAPDGRLDAVWNDTRADPGGFDSELYYSFSHDGGTTWSPGQPVSPVFDPHLGFPQQQKLGDYYHMVSDAGGAHLAYAATFNGEQDVYYLHLGSAGLFADDFESGDLSAWSASLP
ncbi:MAG: exo-alpha-sialidase [Acidobacteria bacterium]|nr:exo-alpha-sialidase [Acidobacteriota bacterium]